MTLTHAQVRGLQAAIVAYLAAEEGGRFARTVAALKEELGGGGEQDTLVVRGEVLGKAWTTFTHEHPQEIGLEAAILAYLVTEGVPFARSLAAFKEEAVVVPGGDVEEQVNQAVSGAVLETAWMHVHRSLSDSTATAALYAAIDAGDLAEVQLYVGVGVGVEALRHGEKERSPFFHAAAVNRLEIVRYFVKLGYDKEVGGRNGSSILYAAAEEGHVTVVQYLVEQGADKNKVAKNGRTPLYAAARNGHVVVVQYLVEQGVDKNKAARNGRTPLLAAVEEGHFAVVQCLVEHGADANRAGYDGRTPLFIAAEKGRIEMVQYLKEQGAWEDKGDEHKRSPLYIAVQHGHFAVVQYLVGEGVRIDKADFDGMVRVAL